MSGSIGLAERIPVPDGWADVIISNGVLNLFPGKFAALQEMARALKPGGRLQIGDIPVEKAVVAAGFVRFEIASRLDAYANALQSSSAARFGTLGVNFAAVRVSNEEEWSAELATLTCTT